MIDDLGAEVSLAAPPRRVVSLVPSLTEAIAVTAPGLLVGATDYCTHPVDLDVPRVGGTKYPSVERVLAAVPDLVVANAEENRREDVEALRAAGVPVWVTYPRTLDAALVSLERMLARLGLAAPPWLDAARAAWAAPPVGPRRRAVVPVWRRPWVVLGPGTFAGDLLNRLGVDNLYDAAAADRGATGTGSSAGATAIVDAADGADADTARTGADADADTARTGADADADTARTDADADRYPRPPLAELLARRPDLVVLPDEPYAFSAQDGPEAFPGLPCALVSGRHLTWYGPSLAEARDLLAAQLTATLTVGR